MKKKERKDKQKDNIHKQSSSAEKRKKERQKERKKLFFEVKLVTVRQVCLLESKIIFLLQTFSKCLFNPPTPGTFLNGLCCYFSQTGKLVETFELSSVVYLSVNVLTLSTHTCFPGQTLQSRFICQKKILFRTLN